MPTENQILWLQISIIIATLLSPIIAVCITLWYQSYHEKRKLKFDTFHTIVAFRDAVPPSPHLVNALNTIDIVFHDCSNVIRLWHEYYDLLHQETVNYEQRKRKYLDLIAEMAKELGYKDIHQTDIDKYYNPIYQYDQAVQN